MRQMRSWLVPLVMLSLLAIAIPAAETVDVVPVPPVLREAVTRLTGLLPNWSVHQVDSEPSVAVGSTLGYRLVLRYFWKEPPPGAQVSQVAVPPKTDDPTYISKHTDLDFVLVPTPGTNTAAKSTIPE